MSADHGCDLPAYLDFGDRPVPDRVGREVHQIPSGGRLACPASGWDDALVLLEAGCVEVRAAAGGHLHLCRGALFSLRGLTPAVLVATGRGPAVLTTLSRRTEGALP